MNIFECRTCKELKEMLVYERETNRELIDTLTSIVRPAPVTSSFGELKPLPNKAVSWSRRRAELEQQERIKATVEQNSKVIAKPDTSDEKINKLEEELGIGDAS